MISFNLIYAQVVQTEEAVFTTKAEANIQYIKSELEALSDGGSLQEVSLDPIQVTINLPSHRKKEVERPNHPTVDPMNMFSVRLRWESRGCRRVKMFRLWIR